MHHILSSFEALFLSRVSIIHLSSLDVLVRVTRGG